MSQAHDTERSGIETVIGGLFSDIRALVRQEMVLAQHEVQYEIGKILKSVLWCGTAAVLALIGLFVGAAVCVLILFEYTGLPAWACAAIVSVFLLGGAWGLAVAGWGVAKSVHVIPLRTVRTLVDDSKWMAEWVRTRFT
ncbi:MAG: phage holin family protein [Nitrospiraceae bacterium]|nr:MAG: phage holin family protein [Nitrospiraceae bacterium]